MSFIHNIVCPVCSYQNNDRVLLALHEYNIHCPKCQVDFVSRAVQIRGKNSRGAKKQNTRDFTVRVRGVNGEDLIEFTSQGYDDFELRSGDIVAFSYVANMLELVQNTTVGRALELATGDRTVVSRMEQQPCYLATYIYGVDSREVALLRRYRDEVLLSSRILSLVVSIYYCASKKAVSVFGNTLIFKKACFFVLIPVVRSVAKHYARGARDPLGRPNAGLLAKYEQQPEPVAASSDKQCRVHSVCEGG